jgi:GT2 family glycosyltransferase
MLKFSIIIPVKELNDFLKESIPKILNMDYDSYEILILPNFKPKIIPNYLKNKKIKIIPSGKVSPAIKRDAGARLARGEYLAFIDDDAYPSFDWLKIAEKIFRKEKVEALGGPAITPEGDSITQKSSGLFFETLFGGGGMSYRYKPSKENFYVEDYPSVNLIVLKKAFLAVGGFDNSFWPGEDTKFCLDFVNKGYKILYVKDLIVYHHRRKDILGHLKQIGNYGKHRGFFAKKYPKTSLKLTYFMPSIFLVGNIMLFLLTLISPLFLKIWLYLLAIYLICLVIDVFSRTSSLKIGTLTMLLVFFSHLTYGYMFLRGIMSRRFKSKLR